MTLPPFVVPMLYFGSLFILGIYGMHRFFMVYLFYRHKGPDAGPASRFEELPPVTVQLPLYNEMYVAERLIDATCSLDYPLDRLEIQVLDDSTDVTTELVAKRVAHWQERGVNIHHVRRPTREGYKAGALAHGLTLAKGELIAIFDADFVPPSDNLRKTVHYFTDPTLGMVQTRWAHINPRFSLLTRLQAVLLDGHFVIEHTARHRSNRFFNFNGTAGIWRRDCIESAGGWHYDTLTEDLDLSYRAQLEGWRFVYLLNQTAPGELPVEMNSFKTQQHRWTKGSIQSAKKLIPTILRSDFSPRVKLEAILHLTNNIAYPMVLLLVLLVLPAVVLRQNDQLYSSPWLGIAVLFAATFSFCIFYICSQKEVHRDWAGRIVYLPMVLSLGVGMALNNALAVIEGLFGMKSEFRRTPKYRIESEKDRWRNKVYSGRRNLLPFLEIGMGVYMAVALIYCIRHGLFAVTPFVFLFLCGFLYVGFGSFYTGGRGTARQACATQQPSHLLFNSLQ